MMPKMPLMMLLLLLALRICRSPAGTGVKGKGLSWMICLSKVLSTSVRPRQPEVLLG